VVIGVNGDVFDRYLVRMEEIRQSVKICRQVLDKMPEGEINIDADSKFILPPKDDVYDSIEGLIYHFEQIMPNRGMTPPKGEAYVATESPNGELGYYIVSGFPNSLSRSHPTAVSYELLYLFQDHDR